MSQCYYIPQFDLFPSVLIDNHFQEQDQDDDGEIKDTRVLEILFIDLGTKSDERECYLFVYFSLFGSINISM